MTKNERPREVNQPVWFDGKSINEALFCDDFLSRHKIIYTNGAFFTPDGRVTNDLPLRSGIFDELRCCAVSANSHFLRTAGPHFPDNPGHIKRTALETSRTERRLRPANQY